MLIRGPRSAQIFVSYRRDDSADVAGRIYDKLVAHFGDQAVFKDVDSIPMGEDFRTVIANAVQQCKVVLVVIGKNWLNMADETGQRRLDNLNDFVRIEVETALTHVPRVIPVLVQNTRMPGPNELPQSLQALAYRNGSLVRSDPDFHRDMERLVRVLETALKAPAPAPVPLPVATPARSVAQVSQTRPSAAQTRPWDRIQIRIISHSRLFYWWPVWMIGFLLAVLTYFEDNRLAVLPAGTTVMAAEPGKYMLELPADKTPTGSLKEAVEKSASKQPAFSIRMSDVTHSHGVVFLTVLVLVLFITNVSLRGMWSFVIIAAVILLSVVLALSQSWDAVLTSAATLHVQINAAGYLFVAGLLFVAWCLSVFVFDPQTRVVFTPGQMRVHEEIGGTEMLFDTEGLVIAKQRDDLFLHWILGLGSGDMVVRTGGTTPREFHLPNVLFLGRKLRLIEEMMRDQPVVMGD